MQWQSYLLDKKLYTISQEKNICRSQKQYFILLFEQNEVQKVDISEGHFHLSYY